MNIFSFDKKQETAFTIDQLQGIYTNLQNLGYTDSLKDFFTDLAAYCHTNGVAANLTDIAAAPYISDRILKHLESLTQAGLPSKIFALCGDNKKTQMELKIPTFFARRQDAVELVTEIIPQLKKFLISLPKGPEWIPGFAPPIHDTWDINKTSQDVRLREENVCGASYSLKHLTIKSESTEDAETHIVPAKVTLNVSAENLVYEIPLFLNTQNTGILETKVISGTGKILTKNKSLLSMSEYMEEFDSYTQSISSASSEVFPCITIQKF